MYFPYNFNSILSVQVDKLQHMNFIFGSSLDYRISVKYVRTVKIQIQNLPFLKFF